MINLRDPLLVVAARDRVHVTDFEYRVLTLAVPFLNEVDARELKAEIIASTLGVDRSNVSRCLKRLTEVGFLIRVDRADHSGVWRYRLPESPKAA
jgi:predicted transcriptional regulator